MPRLFHGRVLNNNTRSNVEFGNSTITMSDTHKLKKMSAASSEGNLANAQKQDSRFITAAELAKSKSEPPPKKTKESLSRHWRAFLSRTSGSANNKDSEGQSSHRHNMSPHHKDFVKLDARISTSANDGLHHQGTSRSRLRLIAQKYARSFSDEEGTQSVTHLDINPATVTRGDTSDSSRKAWRRSWSHECEAQRALSSPREINLTGGFEEQRCLYGGNAGGLLTLANTKNKSFDESDESEDFTLNCDGLNTQHITIEHRPPPKLKSNFLRLRRSSSENGCIAGSAAYPGGSLDNSSDINSSGNKLLYGDQHNVAGSATLSLDQSDGWLQKGGGGTISPDTIQQHHHHHLHLDGGACCGGGSSAAASTISNTAAATATAASSSSGSKTKRFKNFIGSKTLDDTSNLPPPARELHTILSQEMKIQVQPASSKVLRPKDLKEDFEKYLRIPFLRQEFHLFLKKEHSEENLLLWNCIEELEKNLETLLKNRQDLEINEPMLNQIESMIDNFIRDGSSFQVNIQCDIRTNAISSFNLLKTLKDAKLLKKCSSVQSLNSMSIDSLSLYDRLGAFSEDLVALRREVETLMREDSFPRFWEEVTGDEERDRAIQAAIAKDEMETADSTAAANASDSNSDYSRKRVLNSRNSTMRPTSRDDSECFSSDDSNKKNNSSGEGSSKLSVKRSQSANVPSTSFTDRFEYFNIKNTNSIVKNSNNSTSPNSNNSNSNNKNAKNKKQTSASATSGRASLSGKVSPNTLESYQHDSNPAAQDNNDDGLSFIQIHQQQQQQTTEEDRSSTGSGGKKNKLNFRWLKRNSHEENHATDHNNNNNNGEQRHHHLFHLHRSEHNNNNNDNNNSNKNNSNTKNNARNSIGNHHHHHHESHDKLNHSGGVPRIGSMENSDINICKSYKETKEIEKERANAPVKKTNTETTMEDFGDLLVPFGSRIDLAISEDEREDETDNNNNNNRKKQEEKEEENKKKKVIFDNDREGMNDSKDKAQVDGKSHANVYKDICNNETKERRRNSDENDREGPTKSILDKDNVRTGSSINAETTTTTTLGYKFGDISKEIYQQAKTRLRDSENSNNDINNDERNESFMNDNNGNEPDNNSNNNCQPT